MNQMADCPKFPLSLAVHAAGLALFALGLYLLGLGVNDVFGSVSKFVGAAILYFGCDELAGSGWRAWHRWRLHRVSRLSEV